MFYHILGRSTLEVSVIGFGCMSLSDDYTQNELLIHKAIGSGINLFDTADIYQEGLNEKMLGKAVKERRKEVLIATKVGNQPRADGSGWDWNPRKEYILQAVENSLKRLQTDFIDLYQLHGGTIDDPIDETIEAFELLQQQGKIRYYGISSIRPNVIREYIQRSKIASVMMQYSLLDRRPEETCLAMLQQNNIGVLARGSVAKGLLIDKPATPYLNHTKEEVAAAAKAVQALTDENRGAAQVATRYVLQHRPVVSAIVGIRTQGQLEEALKAVEAPILSEEELAALDRAVPANRYEQHR